MECHFLQKIIPLGLVQEIMVDDEIIIYVVMVTFVLIIIMAKPPYILKQSDSYTIYGNENHYHTC